MRKSILLILLTSMLIAVYAEESIFVKGTMLNFRKSPDGKKIGVLNYGTKMEKLKKEGNWVKVKIEGWVWEPLTTPETPKEENIQTKKSNKSKTYRTVMWNSSLHSDAGSNSQIIGTLKKGERIEILKEKKLTFKGITVPWYYAITQNGKKGWVSDADLELP